MSNVALTGFPRRWAGLKRQHVTDLRVVFGEACGDDLGLWVGCGLGADLDLGLGGGLGSGLDSSSGFGSVLGSALGLDSGFGAGPGSSCSTAAGAVMAIGGRGECGKHLPINPMMTTLSNLLLTKPAGIINNQKGPILLLQF